MFTNLYSSTNYFYSAKATKTRSGCWNSAAVEFWVVAVKALYFCICVLQDARTRAKSASARSVESIKRGSFSGIVEWCFEDTMACVETSSCRCSKYRSSKIWCCNSAARVMRCQRRGRGFESPQHRHGIGRLEVRTLVCETKDTGANPVQSPKLGVAQQ